MRCLIVGSFDCPTLHTFLPHTREAVFLRQHTDLTVGPANKTTQSPTDDAHDDGAEKSIPESIDVEPGHESSGQPKCQRVHDEDEEPECDDDERETQQKKNRADKCIDDPEEQ